MPACQIKPGNPCTVPQNANPVTLALANAVKGTIITAAGIQPINGSYTVIEPSADDQSIQIPIAKPGTFLVTVTLNQVKPKNPTYSVSLSEACENETSIIYFYDGVSQMGQVILEVQ